MAKGKKVNGPRHGSEETAPDGAAPVIASRESNLYVRSAQLDEETCAALDAWQAAHGVRSGSAALRLLVQQALAADGTLDVEKRVKVAHSGALRAARVAVLDALDALLE